MTFTSAAVLLLLLTSTTCGQPAEVVQTTLGPVQGVRESVLGKEYDVYWGIPFAKPPMGDLRFKRPEPADPWNGTLSADTKPNSCPQTIITTFNRFPGEEMWNPNTNVSEDCLYLNLWVPRAFGAQPPLTTMVWIYGGGFTTGASTLDVYNGAKLAVTENVVVASLNYRVGAMGFLYTGTMDAPGNQGLLDQALALKWIYDNVVSFGGRQDSITIFGESAGSVSVGFHMLSNVSQGYFTRAIMESGSPTAEWTMLTHAEATRKTQVLSSMLNCSRDSISAMVNCLRQLDAETIFTTQWDIISRDFWLDIPLLPVVDGFFILEEPRALLAQGKVKDTQLLTGSNKDEGMFFLIYTFPDMLPMDGTANISKADFTYMLNKMVKNKDEEVIRALVYEYVDSVMPANRPAYQFVADDFGGDNMFICPVVDFAAVFASLGGAREVYMYSYEHEVSSNPWPDWMGVMHGYEIEAVFGLPQRFNYTTVDQEVATRITGYWTRFAITGNPNNGSDSLWPRLTAQDSAYLRISEEGDSVGVGLRHRQCTFLSTILPLLTHGTPTSCPATAVDDDDPCTTANP